MDRPLHAPHPPADGHQAVQVIPVPPDAPFLRPKSLASSRVLPDCLNPPPLSPGHPAGLPVCRPACLSVAVFLRKYSRGFIASAPKAVCSNLDLREVAPEPVLLNLPLLNYMRAYSQPQSKGRLNSPPHKYKAPPALYLDLNFKHLRGGGFRFGQKFMIF